MWSFPHGFHRLFSTAGPTVHNKVLQGTTGDFTWAPRVKQSSGHYLWGGWGIKNFKSGERPHCHQGAQGAVRQAGKGSGNAVLLATQKKMDVRGPVLPNAMQALHSQRRVAHNIHAHLYALRILREYRTDGSQVSCMLAQLKRCANLNEGRKVHQEAVENGLSPGNMYVTNSIIAMYARFHSMREARQVFDNIRHPDIVSWNALLAGYAENRESEKVLDLFHKMTVEANSRTWVSVLKACSHIAKNNPEARERILDIGTRIRQKATETPEQSIYLENSLLDMYCSCGQVEDAKRLFDIMKKRTVITWNLMIQGYVRHRENQLALDAFKRMDVSPDARTYVAVIAACTNLASESGPTKETLRQTGIAIHLQAEKSRCIDTFVASSLISMYAKFGQLGEARKVFDKTLQRDMFVWNMMLMAYVNNGRPDACLQLYHAMQEKAGVQDAPTFVPVLQACGDLATRDPQRRNEYLETGREIHDRVRKWKCLNDKFVQGALVDMYGKCGSLEDALAVLKSMKDRNNVACWNNMILAYRSSGKQEAALEIFKLMKTEGCVPDAVTCIAVLRTCGDIMALNTGAEVHALIKLHGLDSNIKVTTCLLEFYGRCGDVSSGENVFQSMKVKDIVAWNTFMALYTQQGASASVFQVFENMIITEQPTSVTFLLLLTTCGHAGLVEKGKAIFRDMACKYKIVPSIRHYTCLVDLLGRAGDLEGAKQTLNTMPFKADAIIWKTLLAACRKWQNVTVGQYAFKSLLHSTSDQCHNDIVSGYVLMADIYQSLGMEDEREKVLAKKKSLKLVKLPGRSIWTDETSEKIHEFFVGDTVEDRKTMEKLTQLNVEMQKHAKEEDKEELEGLCAHSERLSVAYALANSSPETGPIRVTKNMRVCEGCHRTTAIVSKIENRTIIVRDASRIHVFKRGRCSCDNYW